MSQATRKGVRVLLFRPGQDAADVRIANTLDGMQEAIGGGWLEEVPCQRGKTRSISLYVDEDGHRKRLPQHRGVLGRFLLVASDAAGNVVDLTDAEVLLFSQLHHVARSPTELASMAARRVVRGMLGLGLLGGGDTQGEA